MLFSSSCAATRLLPHKKLTGAPSDLRKVDGGGSRPGWSACSRRRCVAGPSTPAGLFLLLRHRLGGIWLSPSCGPLRRPEICRGWLATVGWDVKTRRRGRLGIGFGLPSYHGVLDALLQTWLCETSSLVLLDLLVLVDFPNTSIPGSRTSTTRKVDGGSPPPYPAISVPPSGHGVAGPTLQ